MGQGFLVVGAFLAAGLFQAAPENFGIVVRGGEERVELERVLAMRQGRQSERLPKRLRNLGRGEISCARRSSSKQIRIVR